MADRGALRLMKSNQRLLVLLLNLHVPIIYGVPYIDRDSGPPAMLNILLLGYKRFHSHELSK